MFVRICSAAILASLLARRFGAGPDAAYSQFSAADVSSARLFKLPDPRGEFVRLCAPHMVGRWAHPESRLRLPARLCRRHRRGYRSARSAAARHQRNRRADDRDRLGAAVEAIRDRRDLHQDRQADAAMHVRAGDEPSRVQSVPTCVDFAHCRRIETVAGSTRRLSIAIVSQWPVNDHPQREPVECSRRRILLSCMALVALALPAAALLPTKICWARPPAIRSAPAPTGSMTRASASDRSAISTGYFRTIR